MELCWLAGLGNGRIHLIPRFYTRPPCEWPNTDLGVADWKRYVGLGIYHRTCQALPNPSEIVLSDFRHTVEEPDYLLLTIGGRLLIVGLVVLALVSLVVLLGMVWLVFRLVRHLIRRVPALRTSL